MNQAYQKTLKAKEERIGELEKRLEEQELTNAKLREEVVAMKKLSKVQRVSSSPMSSPKVPRDHRFSMQYVASTVHVYYVHAYMCTYILLVTACIYIICIYVRTYTYVIIMIIIIYIIICILSNLDLLYQTRFPFVLV